MSFSSKMNRAGERLGSRQRSPRATSTQIADTHARLPIVAERAHMHAGESRWDGRNNTNTSGTHDSTRDS